MKYKILTLFLNNKLNIQYLNMIERNQLEKKLLFHMENRVQPFVWKILLSILMSILVFYGNYILAFKIGSLAYSFYQLINLCFCLLTEKITLTLKNDSWKSKFLLFDRTLINKKYIPDEDFDADMYVDSYYYIEIKEYIYEVRILSPLCEHYQHIDLVVNYLFIPMFKIGLIRDQYIYQKDIVNNIL